MPKTKKRKAIPNTKKSSPRLPPAPPPPSIGFLVAAKYDDWDLYFNAFKGRLKTKASITVLPANGADGDLKTIDVTADYCAQCFDVIVTAGTYAALSCKRATQKYPNLKTKILTPFVFASIGDPAGSGLVPKTPTDNFCGGDNKQVHVQVGDNIVDKRVKHMLNKCDGPFAVVGNPKGTSGKAMDLVLDALKQNGVNDGKKYSINPGDSPQLIVSSIRGDLRKTLFVCSDVFVTSVATEIVKEASPDMQTMWEFKEHKTKHGGSAAYGVSFADLFKQAADAVDQILDGSKTPYDLGIWTAADGPA